MDGVWSGILQPGERTEIYREFASAGEHAHSRIPGPVDRGFSGVHTRDQRRRDDDVHE